VGRRSELPALLGLRGPAPTSRSCTTQTRTRPDVSLDYTQELHDHHVLQSTGTGGDALDKALAETLASVGAVGDGLG
jgi:hypothetical protein